MKRIIFLLAFYACNAYSVITPPSTLQYYVQYSICSYYGYNVRSACQALIDAQGHPNGISFAISAITSSSCSIDHTYGYWTTFGVNTTSVQNACPSNSTGSSTCTCNAGYMEDTRHTSCIATGTQVLIDQSSAKSCHAKPGSSAPSGDISTPNPLHPLVGNKTKSIPTGMSVAGLDLVFFYDTAPFLMAAAGLTPITSGVGRFWGNNLSRNLVDGVSGGYSKLVTSGNQIAESARVVSAMNATNAIYQIDSASGNTLTDFGAGAGLSRTLVATGSVEHYSDAGKLLSVTDSSGQTANYTYEDVSGYLASVTDSVGRSLTFGYTGDVLSTVTDTAGRVVSLVYDTSNNLKSITWPDGQILTFVYEDAALSWALTGIVDENGARTQTYSYDAQGHAMNSESAGGVNAYTVSPYATAPQVTATTSAVDPVTGLATKTVGWSAPEVVTLTMPNGQVSVINSATVNGKSLATSASQPAGSGCSAASSAWTYHANGNVTSSDDFNGARTCYGYDSQNRETSRVEGLTTSTDCAYMTAAAASLPASARKFTTIYHPNLTLPIQVTGPASRVTTVLNGQPDPYSGATASSCAPAGATLACKIVTEGILGGAVDASVPAEVVQFTYDAAGRIVTATDTLNRLTSYSYYPTTVLSGTAPNQSGHTLGDLASITNPAGMVTTFDIYDPNGKLLQMTDAKGVVTRMTYTPRGWVSTVSTTAPGNAARTTSYSYDAVGQMIGVSNPDGTVLSFTYDAAHRLIGATDARGNTVTYILDNVGNRIAEQIKDPSGNLQRSITRSFDALNRLQQVSGSVQ
jgi:YD repeat-containing protein